MLDNLSSGKPGNPPPQAELVVGDVTNVALVGDIVEGLVLARRHAETGNGADVVNLSTGTGTTLIGLAAA